MPSNSILWGLRLAVLNFEAVTVAGITFGGGISHCSNLPSNSILVIILSAGMSHGSNPPSNVILT